MNGSYSLMSEALSLGKPVLAEPVQKQFEQILNALLLEKAGFGMMTNRISKEDISLFMRKIPAYKAAIAKKKWQRADGANEAARVIEEVVAGG